jgi:hypothetical protein
MLRNLWKKKFGNSEIRNWWKNIRGKRRSIFMVFIRKWSLREFTNDYFKNIYLTIKIINKKSYSSYKYLVGVGRPLHLAVVLF